MVKPAIIALLTILSLLLIKANIDTFRATPTALESDSPADPKKVSKPKTPLPPFNLNPIRSPQAPDLNSGYLFSAQRFLAKDARTSTAGQDSDQNIRLEDIVFNGALLAGAYKKALVSYSLGSKQAIRTTTRPGPGPKTQDTPRQGTIQLSIGDQLGGYTVKEIAPDFILFSKGSETIKKTLFDPDKERAQAPPRPATATSAPQTPSVIPPARRMPPPVQNP